jgi:hypothetical protein
MNIKRETTSVCGEFERASDTLHLARLTRCTSRASHAAPRAPHTLHLARLTPHVASGKRLTASEKALIQASINHRRTFFCHVHVTIRFQEEKKSEFEDLFDEQ